MCRWRQSSSLVDGILSPIIKPVILVFLLMHKKKKKTSEIKKIFQQRTGSCKIPLLENANHADDGRHVEQHAVRSTQLVKADNWLTEPSWAQSLSHAGNIRIWSGTLWCYPTVMDYLTKKADWGQNVKKCRPYETISKWKAKSIRFHL